MLVSIPLWVDILLSLLLIGLITVTLALYTVSRKLGSFMQGKDGQSLEASMQWLTEKHAQVNDTLTSHKEALEQIDSRVKRSIQAQSLVHYNAFEDTGGDQSFASALLNEDGDGYILSIITHRNQTHVYAKRVNAFKTTSALTDEEQNALTNAEESL